MPGTNGNTNMQRWNAMARPPVTALKQIKGGRLKGMTDVNPQWRYQAMTEQYGPCGEGWRYTIDKLWTEPGVDGEVLGFAQVSLFVRRAIGENGSYHESEAIIGIGGNHLVMKETSGLRANDECWKMAVTDALSVAMKMLGVAADIYAGLWDGSKYREDVATESNGTPASNGTSNGHAPSGFDARLAVLQAAADEGTPKLMAEFNASHLDIRKHLTGKQNAIWEALKTRASRVRVAS